MGTATSVPEEPAVDSEEVEETTTVNIAPVDYLGCVVVRCNDGGIDVVSANSFVADVLGYLQDELEDVTFASLFLGVEDKVRALVMQEADSHTPCSGALLHKCGVCIEADFRLSSVRPPTESSDEELPRLVLLCFKPNESTNIVAVDIHQKITYLNKGAGALFGLSEGAARRMHGHAFTKLFPHFGGSIPRDGTSLLRGLTSQGATVLLEVKADDTLARHGGKPRADCRTLRVSLAGSTAPILSLNSNSTIVAAHPSLAMEMFGMTPRDLRGRPFGYLVDCSAQALADAERRGRTKKRVKTRHSALGAFYTWLDVRAGARLDGGLVHEVYLHHRRMKKKTKKAAGDLWNLTVNDGLPPLIATALSRYEPQKTLGEGSGGCVFLAHDKLRRGSASAPTLRALKIACVGRSGDSTAAVDLFRLRSEVRALEAAAAHKNIVRLFDAVDSPSVVCLALEYIDGGTLLDRLKKLPAGASQLSYGATRVPLDEDLSRLYFAQIFDAMAFLHSHRIVHCDIKLENIMETNDGVVKIIDFGYAKIVAEGELITDFCGTAGYVAPEVFYHRPFHERVDVWSVGVCLFFMTTGAMPFPSPEATMNGEVFNHDHWVDVLSRPLVELLGDMLTVNIDDRPAMANAGKHAWFSETTATCVDTAMASLGVQPATTGGGARRGKRPRRKAPRNERAGPPAQPAMTAMGLSPDLPNLAPEGKPKYQDRPKKKKAREEWTRNQGPRPGTARRSLHQPTRGR